MLHRLLTMLKHRWMDGSDTRRVIGPDMLDRLTRRVAASEQRHSGEIRIFVEAGLPTSYLWRHLWNNDFPAMDILIRTPAEMKKAAGIFQSVETTAETHGRVLYAA